MMERFRKSPVEKVYTLLAFAIIAAIIYFFYMLTAKFLTWFSTLENQIAASIITASAVALISTLGLILSKHYEHKREIKREQNNKKIPIYEELINFSFKFHFAEKRGDKPPDEKEVIKFLAEFIPKLIVWSDERVMKSLIEFRDTVQNDPDRPSAEILFRFEKMLLNIRKDLGHKDKKLKKGDILRFFVSDIQNYLPHRNV